MMETVAIPVIGPANPDATEGQGLDRHQDAPGTPGVVELVPQRPIDLNNVRAVRRELAALYRACRSGQVSAADGSRMAFMLATLAKLLELETFEARIAALEAMRSSDANT